MSGRNTSLHKYYNTHNTNSNLYSQLSSTLPCYTPYSYSAYQQEPAAVPKTNNIPTTLEQTSLLPPWAPLLTDPSA